MKWADAIPLIQTRFEEQVVVNLSSDTVVMYDNLNDDLEDDQVELNPRVLVTVLPGESRQVTFGKDSRRFRYPGIMSVLIGVPVARGKAEAYEIVKTVETAFRPGSYNSIRWRVPSVTRIGPVGKYWQLSVQCPLEFDDID